MLGDFFGGPEDVSRRVSVVSRVTSTHVENRAWPCSATSCRKTAQRYAHPVIDRVERIRFLAEMARVMQASGADADQVAQELLRRTDSPISAIKAVADATGMALGDAKWVVHRNLNPQVRKAAEGLWDELLDGVRQLNEPPDVPYRHLD